MRNTTARRLRLIARGLGLPAKTAYAPGRYRDETGEWHALPSTQVMTECERRAYKEAKKIFLGKPISALLPEGEERRDSFAKQVVDSTREYFNAPM